MILALISTASIFPDLLASGSIDLYLSKPIGRLRLFLTKYLGGLLFVLLQATVFAVGSYVVFGLRAGQWRTSMFLIIPLATLLFSYLFAVCVLVGVLTRSTIAAILITCIFWLLCAATNKAEQVLFAFRTLQTAEARAFERQARAVDADIAKLKDSPSVLNAFGFREARMKQRRDELNRRAGESAARAANLITAHTVVAALPPVIPKTGETVDLLDRRLFDDEDLAAMREQMADEDENPFGGPRRRRDGGRSPIESTAPRPTTSPTSAPSTGDIAGQEARREAEQRREARLEAQEEADRATRSRSVAWVLGTSIAFETVVLSFAAWVFCRRDY
jgi:hypothetical protein